MTEKIFFQKVIQEHHCFFLFIKKKNVSVSGIFGLKNKKCHWHDPRRGGLGGRSPLTCRPPFFLVRVGVQKKSCFDLAENRAAVSLWVGAHRYQRNSRASKLLWVQNDLKLTKFVIRILNPQGFTKEFDFWPNKTLQFFSGPGIYLYQKLLPDD